MNDKHIMLQTTTVHNIISVIIYIYIYWNNTARYWGEKPINSGMVIDNLSTCEVLFVSSMILQSVKDTFYQMVLHNFRSVLKYKGQNFRMKTTNRVPLDGSIVAEINCYPIKRYLPNTELYGQIYN